MTTNDIKLIRSLQLVNNQIIEHLIWLKALLIKNGICPDCGAKETMSDKKGMLWCSECGASYNYVLEVEKSNQVKEIMSNDK